MNVVALTDFLMVRQRLPVDGGVIDSLMLTSRLHLGLDWATDSLDLLQHCITHLLSDLNLLKQILSALSQQLHTAGQVTKRKPAQTLTSTLATVPSVKKQDRKSLTQTDVFGTTESIRINASLGIWDGGPSAGGLVHLGCCRTAVLIAHTENLTGFFCVHHETLENDKLPTEEEELLFLLSFMGSGYLGKAELVDLLTDTLLTAFHGGGSFRSMENVMEEIPESSGKAGGCGSQAVDSIASSTVSSVITDGIYASAMVTSTSTPGSMLMLRLDIATGQSDADAVNGHLSLYWGFTGVFESL
ncbi:hypothetical protein DNTS_018465 [Danionella cerebrum]|uniref:Uncharacterized protein n=1 Tax=Danionella cerebrum TaxID=2873325 RepID=A0A553Q946_9TELE|nr:hypothetical protein DNTS_018465 [Danionella translucida]